MRHLDSSSSSIILYLLKDGTSWQAATERWDISTSRQLSLSLSLTHTHTHTKRQNWVVGGPHSTHFSYGRAGLLHSALYLECHRSHQIVHSVSRRLHQPPQPNLPMQLVQKRSIHPLDYFRSKPGVIHRLSVRVVTLSLPHSWTRPPKEKRAERIRSRRLEKWEMEGKGEKGWKGMNSSSPSRYPVSRRS